MAGYDPLGDTQRRFGDRYPGLSGVDEDSGLRINTKPQEPDALRMLRRLREQRAAREQTQVKQETLADPGFWEEALDAGKSVGGSVLEGLGTLMDNTPFAGVPETLAGLASYPAEGLGRLTGAGEDGRGAADFQDMDAAGAALNLNPLGLIANMVGLGTGDSDLRKRGKEFFEKASRGLSAGDQEVLGGYGTKAGVAAINPIATAAVVGNEAIDYFGDGTTEGPLTHIGLGQGGKTDDALYRMGLETAVSGPLNITPAGGTEFIGSAYNAAKASKAGAWMIEKFPRAALLPERAWLKVSGAAKRSAVLGDDQMQRLYTAQQAFEDEAAPAFQRLYQDILVAEKDAFAKLALKPEQEAAVRQGILEIAEQPAAWRRVAAHRLTDDEMVKEALVEMADLYGDYPAKAAALERKFKIGTKDMVSDVFEYAQREASPELRAWTAANPTARKILTGERRKLDRQAFESAWAGFEHGRKLGDLNINEAEDVIRASLSKAGLPENIPIFARDAFGGLARRTEANMHRAKVRNLYAAATDVFGQSADQKLVQDVVYAVLDEKQALAWKRAADAALGAVDATDMQAGFRQGREEVRKGFAESAGPATDRPVANVVNQTVRDAKGAAREAAEKAENLDPAKWSPELKAQWVETVVKRAGISGPPRSMSALELLRSKKVPLPDNLDDLSRMATTFVDPEDAAKVAKYADNFYSRGLDRGAVGKWYDGLKQIYQRATLARPSSLTKDLIGTTSQGFIAGNTVADLAQAVQDLGGSSHNWAKGVGKGFTAPDDALRLMAEGVLQTTKEEALAKGAFEGVPVLGRIEERGVLGALIPGKAGEAVGKATDELLHARVWYEQTHRLATYRKAIREGMNHKQAVEEVYKHFGQFNELTKLERTALNRMLFFWTWMVRSVPVAMRNLVDHPIRSRILLTLMAHGEQGAPDWFNRMGGYVLGVDENGNADAIGTGGSTYFSPLFSLLQGETANALAAGDYGAILAGEDGEYGKGGLARDVLRSAPPFVSVPAMWSQGTDPFTGEALKDEQGHSNVKAPMAFYWLMNHNGEPNAIERVLGLTAKTDKQGNLRGLTIDPHWGFLMRVLPGVDVAASDVSSFVDPRQADASGLSLGKGAARQAGFPVYRFSMDDKQEKNLKDFRKALHKEVGKLSGGGLDVVYGRVSPTTQTARGHKMRNDVDRWQAEADRQGLGPKASRAYVDQRLSRLYQHEWRLIELDRRLKVLQDSAREEEEKRKLTDLSLAARLTPARE